MNRREMLTALGVATVVACRGAAKPEVKPADTTVTLIVDGMI